MPPRIKTRTSLAALALTAFAAAATMPARSAPAPQMPPEAEMLLDWALTPPSVTYRGRMMFSQWFGTHTRAEDIQVYQSGERSRREFLAPDGTPARALVSDGERQEVHLVKKGRVLHGDAVKTYEKVMPAEQERVLLLKNYTLSASGPESVAGRPCWALKITPLAPGKPAQKLCLDQETRVALENKRFIPGKSFATMVRYTRFEPQKELPEELFALDQSTAAASSGKGLEPDFLTLDQLNKETGKDSNLPAELPGGFQFESADFFVIGKSTVRHARYTDGLSVLSLFLTEKPVRLPKGEALPSLGLPRASLRLSSAGKVLHWQRGRQHYTMLGDCSRGLLQTIAAALK